jgi:PAS domain S-box-containing protein
MAEVRSVQGSLFAEETAAAGERLVGAEEPDRGHILIDASRELILRMNGKGSVTDLHCVGIPKSQTEEYLGTSLETILGQDLARKLRKRLKRLLETGEIQVFDHMTTRLDMEREYEIRLVRSGDDGAAVIIRNVGESRTAQFRLMESENRYRSLLDRSLQGTLILQDYHVVYANEAVARIAGFSVDELLELSPEDLTRRVHPADRDMVWGRLRDRLENKPAPSHYECRFISRDGDIRWIEIFSSRLEYRGKPAVQASIVDITERKNAEEALHVEKAYLEELFENAPESIVLVDNDSRVLRANDEFVRTFGYSMEDLLGKSVDELIAPQELREEAQTITRRISQGERVYVETVRQRRDGTRLNVSIVGNPIMVAGKQVGVYGIYRDISERKSMEEKYRVLVENATDAIVIVQNDLIKFHNPKLETVLGLAAEELTDHSFFNCVHPDDRERVSEVYRRWLLGEEPTSTISVRTLHRNGDVLWGEVNAVRILWDEQPALLCFIRDISTEKRLGAQLQQAQKMEAIGTLAGGVAHDFNNLLQAVLGYADLLVLNRSEDDYGYRELQGIRSAALRASVLTQQLLTFSRKVESKLRPVDLNNEVRQVHELLVRTIPKMITIKLKLEKYLRTVNADPTQIGQALMNLAVNAKDAMPDGGTLTMETENVTLDERFCKSHVGARPGDHVKLSVTDTGLGMDRETRAHIFEPFYTRKPMGTGTGLGLAMVYGIVKSHMGYITCESGRGKGTRFDMYLPVIEQDAALEETAEEPVPRGGNETILIIDDEKLIRDLGEKALNKFGYMVITAPDGESALKLYSREWERIDLIILDLIMPRMSGNLCFEEIMRVNPNARVIIASGYSDNGQMRKSIEGRARGFIGKPFNVKRLLRIIREILDNDRDPNP